MNWHDPFGVASRLIGPLSQLIWFYLLAFRGEFWRTGPIDDAPGAKLPRWPSVVAVVPARDEADVILRSIGSLLAQDYPGSFRIILVDDNSTDGTDEIARNLVPCPERGEGLPQTSEGERRLTVIPGTPLPHGWTGKLWALAQGIEAAGTPEYLWLTDADIAHTPDTLRALVSRAENERLVLVSRMARLVTRTFAERALVPAFVWFFRMLYPFQWVNRPANRTAAAAGGCVLLDSRAFAAAGGITAIRSRIIDDCALGRLMKRYGPIRLSLTHNSVALRGYGGFERVSAMIARSAFAQLGYSPLLLVGVLLAMVLVFLGPVITIVAHTDYNFGPWLMMTLLFVPILRFYRQSQLWAFALPLIALFYAVATLASAIQHWRGRGGMWKGRAQAMRPA